MSWYQSWHNHRFHPHIHWSTFLATSLLATLFLLNQINQAYQGYPDVLRVEADVTTGLVAHYTFDEGSGTTAGDSAGSNTGTLTNGPTWTSGQIGGAISFDGVNDKINFGSASSLDNIELQGGGGMTVSFWINPTSNTFANIINKGNNSAGTGTWSIAKHPATNPARLSFVKSGAVTATASYNSTLTVGQWQHIVITWNGSMTFSGGGVKAYKNGVLLTNGGFVDGSNGISDAPSDLCIGNTGSSCTQTTFADMSLDDVRIYNRVLSASDISELYSYSGSGSPPPPPPLSDTAPPTVSISSPTNAATVSGATTLITANASDNVGVAGVTFKLDGNNLGSEDTSAPYSFTWDTTSISNGAHTLTAVVRDTSNNTTTSSGISVTVNNGVTPPPPIGECAASNIRCVPSEYSTIQACANVAVAGDTCLVSPGLYNERVGSVNSGTAGNMITYRATTDCVSNNGATIAPSCAKVRAWAVASDNYITIQGFEITSIGMSPDPTNRHVVISGTNHVSLLNNYIHDLDGSYPCAQAATSANTIFRGNNIQTCAEVMDVFATIRGPYNIQAGVNDKISFSVQGGPAQIVTLTPGPARTAGQLFTDVNAQLAGAKACIGVMCGSQFMISSNIIGPTSLLEVLPVASNAYATLGMSVGLGSMVGHGIAVSGGTGMTDWRIENNVLSHVSDYITPGSGDKLVVRNNIIGPSDPYNSIHIDFLQPAAFTRVLVEGNRLIDNTSNDNHFMLNEVAGADHWITRFNSTCRSLGGAGSLRTNYFYFYNNTFYDNFAYMYGNHGHQVRVNSPNNFARNNIWYKSLSPTDQLYGFITGGIDRDYDLWFMLNNQSQPHGVNADPLVVNGANCDFNLQPSSPAIDKGGPLTTVSVIDSGNGTSLRVNDAKPFQDGWAGVNPDWIAVGTTGNATQISSINYTTNTITLATPISRTSGQPVWLYKNSSGQQVLYGSAPDIGAYEFCSSNCSYAYPSPYATPYVTPYNYPTPGIPYTAPSVSGGLDGETGEISYAAPTSPGEAGVPLTEETKKALIIQIMIQLIVLLTELIVKIKMGAASVISAFSNWSF